jgi:hypothetical protein
LEPVGRDQHQQVQKVQTAPILFLAQLRQQAAAVVVVTRALLLAQMVGLAVEVTVLPEHRKLEERHHHLDRVTMAAAAFLVPAALGLAAVVAVQTRLVGTHLQTEQ